MKKSTKKKIALSSMGLFLLLIVGIITWLTIKQYHQVEEPEKVVRFGFIGPLTGPAASYGVAQMKGIELAVREINASGGLDNKRLEVIFEDSQMDPNKSISAMKKLIEIDRVPAVIGETSTTATLAIANIANRTKTVLLSPLASGAKITDAGDYVFRASPSDNLQAVVAARFVIGRDLRKGGIVYTNDDWGGGLYKAFEKDFKALGGVILISDGVTPGTQDFRTQLVKIKTLHPDFIFIPLHPNESAIFLRQVKELKVSGQIIGGDNFSEKAILKTAGKAADGVIFTMPAQPSGKEYLQFAKSFKAKFNEDASYSSAAAYDCVYLLMDAIKKGEPIGDQIKNALYKIKDYHGASGVIGFDEHGDVKTKKFEIVQIINGKYIPYQKP